MYGTGNPDNVQYDAWSPVKWSATDLGGSDSCDLTGCNPKLESVKIASVGDIKLDDRLVGLEDGAVIKIALVELPMETIKKMIPWYATGDQVHGLPPVGSRLYQYAAELVLHPSHLPHTGTGADLTQDFHVRKAVPWKAFQIQRPGTGKSFVSCEFLVYPDRTKLAAGLSAYFYFGAAEGAS